MPYAPHYRVTALGRLGPAPGAERFSYSLNLGRPDGGPTLGLGPNEAFWVDVAGDIAAFHGRPSSLIANVAVLEEVKVARIGSDGKYEADPLIVNVTDTPGGMTGTATVAPILPQSALAVSLVTARRGPSGKGRFYIPMPVAALGTDLLMTAAAAQGVAESAQTLLNDIDNAPGIDVLGIEVVVASTKGFNTDVTGVRVGRVVDTIRSRRRSLPESYGVVLPVG